MAIGLGNPGDINNYTRFGEQPPEDNELPVSSKNRKLTDKSFLYTFVACVIILIPLTAYTLYYSDINRLLNGYDNCGNVCGQLNKKYPQWECSGQDMRNKPSNDDGRCVAGNSTAHEKLLDDVQQKPFVHERKRSGYFEDNSYVDDTNDADFYKDTHKNTETSPKENFLPYVERVVWKLATACLLSIVLCQGMVLLFRYATAMIVWTITILSWILLLVLCVHLWIMVGNTPNTNLVIPAVVLSAVLLLLLCIMVFMRKSIELVIMLLKESTKAVFDMPTTFAIPFVAIIGGAIIGVVWFVLTLYMYSSGILTEEYSGHLKYVPNVAMIVALVWNLIITIWVFEFIYGIQYMIISGAVGRWYFTRDKSLLASPVRSSSYVTFRFHLGTIAVGSLILTLVTVLRIILKSLARNPRLRLIIDCCMRYIEAIIRFFTTNAYIFTALHGTPFYTSGKKVTGLLMMNICNIMALNNIGDFVLRMAQVFLMIISYFLTANVFLVDEERDINNCFCIIIVVAITGICSYTIMGTVEIAVNSMFVCFCEDSTMNDGITKPYYMTTGLMQFIENSKVVFAHTIQKKGLPTI